MSPNNDGHILRCIRNNHKLFRIVFYCYSDWEFDEVKKIKNSRFEIKRSGVLWKQLGIVEKKINANYPVPDNFKDFVEFANVVTGYDVSNEIIRSEMNSLPQFQISKLCLKVKEELIKYDLLDSRPKDNEEFIKNFAFISQIATRYGILPPTMVVLVMREGIL